MPFIRVGINHSLRLHCFIWDTFDSSKLHQLEYRPIKYNAIRVYAYGIFSFSYHEIYDQ